MVGSKRKRTAEAVLMRQILLSLLGDWLKQYLSALIVYDSEMAAEFFQYAFRLVDSWRVRSVEPIAETLCRESKSIGKFIDFYTSVDDEVLDCLFRI